MKQYEIEQEMAWTPMSLACKSMAVDEDGHLRLCRRDGNHKDLCASNYPYIEWDKNEGSRS